MESGRGVSGIRLGMVDAALGQEDVAEARRHLAIVAPTAFDGGSEQAQARCIEAYGRLAEHAGEYELAARLLSAAATWREGHAGRSLFWDVELDLADSARARVHAELSEAACADAEASGRAMSLQEARELAEQPLVA